MELRKIAILCGSSWPFRQATNLLLQLTGVELSFSHIRCLRANEAKIVDEQDPAEYDQVEWESLADPAEVLVESVADRPQPARIKPAQHSADNHSPFSPIYLGSDGTFISAQPANRFLQVKAAIIFTNQRVTVNPGRNVSQNKRYVGSCLSVSKWSGKPFSCASKMGISNQTKLIILADGAR